MLNGIGGRTIAEAQERMLYPEFVSWCRYRNKWGPLHPGMRLDRATGRIGAYFVSMLARRRDISFMEFSPYDRAAKEREVDSPQTMFAKLKSIAGRGR